MKWTIILTSLLVVCFIKDADAKGRIFDYLGGGQGKSSSDGFFVNNPVLDFLIFLAIVGGVLVVIGLIMAAWKAVRGPSDPSERGLLDSGSENGSDYNIQSQKSGGNNYGIANPEEIFSNTRHFVERVGEKTAYQRMPENRRDDRMDIDSSSHRMFDMFDRRPRGGGGDGGGGAPWGSNYQNIQEESQDYYSAPGYYRN